MTDLISAIFWFLILTIAALSVITMGWMTRQDMKRDRESAKQISEMLANHNDELQQVLDRLNGKPPAGTQLLGWDMQDMRQTCVEAGSLGSGGKTTHYCSNPWATGSGGTAEEAWEDWKAQAKIAKQAAWQRFMRGSTNNPSPSWHGMQDREPK